MTLVWAAQRDAEGILAVVLENDRLRVTVLPELGGKIWSIVSTPRDREMLWHHPTLSPKPVAPGDVYDDVFCGGWDELFPSDAPVTIDGFDLPDHGEWWSIPWAWSVDDSPDALTLTLEAAGFATPHEARRTIMLRAGLPRIELTTRIHNSGDCPIPYLWRHHPALPVRPGARIDLPPAKMLVDAALTPTIASEPFIWPRARSVSGQAVELGTLPAANSGETWMLYATELPEGWVVVSYPDEGIVLRLEFDPVAVDTFTLFATFGGWRGLATILPEPGVGYPADLRQAKEQGRHGILHPGAMVEYALTAVVAGEFGHVAG